MVDRNRREKYYSYTCVSGRLYGVFGRMLGAVVFI